MISTSATPDLFRDAHKKLLQRQKQLLHLRQDLEDDSDDLQTDDREADWLDLAQLQRDVDLNERIGAQGLQELRDIQAALSRIETGTYGQCLRCKEPIDPKRLQVLPQAKLCLECSEASESPRQQNS